MGGGDFWVSTLAGWWSMLLLCSQRCQLAIDVLLWLQWMPLGDGAAWISQHVGPVLKTKASRLAAHEDLSNGVILTDLVIIKDCDRHQDFLRREQDNASFSLVLPPKTSKCELFCFTAWTYYDQNLRVLPKTLGAVYHRTKLQTAIHFKLVIL